MGNRLAPSAAAGVVRPWKKRATRCLGLLLDLLRWLRLALGRGTGRRRPGPGRWEAQDPEPFDISFHLVRHLFDLCAVAFLRLASPLSRACLDVLGLRGLPAVWLHGLALFLATSYGLSLLLWLLRAYLAHLTLAFGALHLLVLGVTLRRAQRTDPGETPPAMGQSAEEAAPAPWPETGRELATKRGLPE